MEELSILIPSRNNMKNIANLLKRIDSSNFTSKTEVIVVDDFSDDGSYEYLNTISKNFRFTLFVLRHNEFKGIGASIKTAISFANGKYLIICDNNDEYLNENLSSIYEKILKGGADCVFGFNLNNSEKNFSSLLNRTLINIINFLYGSFYKNISYCYKAFKKDVIKSLKLHSDGIEIYFEMLSKIALNKYSFIEIPLNYNSDIDYNLSKISFNTFVKSIFLIFKIRFFKVV